MYFLKRSFNVYFFFFSSRRRHTRCSRDWSSDVCSSDLVEVTGNAAAVNAVKLVARVEGYLDKIHYQDGQSVKKGDLLFTIQQDQYKDQLQQAQAQVLAAQAALAHAKIELPRYSALVKKDAATQTQVDEWVYQKAAAQAQLLG